MHVRLLPDDILDVYRRNQLVPRFGEPSDMAAVVAFLLSESAKFITGQVLNVEGALLAHTPILADLSPE